MNALWFEVFEKKRINHFENHSDCHQATKQVERAIYVNFSIQPVYVLPLLKMFLSHAELGKMPGEKSTEHE